MLTFIMEAAHDFKVMLCALPVQDPIIDSPVGDAHLCFIGLPVEQSGRRGLVNDLLWGFQVCQKGENLCHSQIADRIKIVRSVTPLGKLAHIGFTSVPGSGYESVFRRRDRVQCHHPQTRREVCSGKR